MVWNIKSHEKFSLKTQLVGHCFIWVSKKNAWYLILDTMGNVLWKHLNSIPPNLNLGCILCQTCFLDHFKLLVFLLPARLPHHSVESLMDSETSQDQNYLFNGHWLTRKWFSDILNSGHQASQTSRLLFFWSLLISFQKNLTLNVSEGLDGPGSLEAPETDLDSCRFKPQHLF